MKRYDYYFSTGAIVSWYNKKMGKRDLAQYTKMYGYVVKVVEA